MANSILSDKFSNYYSTHQISESRLERLKSQDKSEATHLGLWDKFKDLFLTNKKQDALNALYDAIHGDSASGKLEAFETLKSCAGQAYQDRFSRQIDDEGKISLLIDEDVVTTYSVKEALKINGDISLPHMTTDEKEQFLKTLDAIHKGSASGKLEAFETLKSCVGQACQGRFSKQIDDEGKISLLIDEDVITTCSVREALYINDDVSLFPMTTDEKELFLKILDVVKEKDRTMVGDENDIGKRKFAVQKEMMADIYAVYRPSEDPERANVEWKSDEIRWDTDKLSWLNSGTFSPYTQFNRIGYQYNPIMEAVEFKMVHPSISFLLGTYSNAEEMAEMTNGPIEDFMKGGSKFLDTMNEEYVVYQENKQVVDEILNGIYELHGDTLCIGTENGSRNRLTILEEN